MSAIILAATLGAMNRFALVLVFAGLFTGPVLADDAAPPPHCGLFCKVWRNVSGHVQNPIPTQSWDDGSMLVPTPEQEARAPRAEDLVAVHGEVIRKTRAERQREQASLADEIKRIDVLRTDGSTWWRNDHAK